MKKNKNIKIIIGIVIAVILSGVTSYAVAKTLIDSKDVIYTDNSKLNAGNVQEAIDGTCSKIDTRLSAIEDKLYTITRISGEEKFTSSTTLAYTGVDIKLPTNSECSITVVAVYINHPPTYLELTSSSTLGNTGMYNGAYQPSTSQFHKHLSVNFSFYTSNISTYYVWAAYNGVGQNRIQYSGFCVTKYKQ